MKKLNTAPQPLSLNMLTKDAKDAPRQKTQKDATDAEAAKEVKKQKDAMKKKRKTLTEPLNLKMLNARTGEAKRP